MNKNMGGVDRTIRGIVGLAIIVWGFVAGNWWGAIGLVLVVTALVGWCPGYVPMKINTGKKA